MADKTPITREQFDALIKQGYTPEEIAADGLVLAPTNRPSAVQTEPAPAAAPKRGKMDGYSRLAQLGRDVISPSKWGEAALSVANQIPGMDEALAGVAGNMAYRKPIADRLRQADEASGDLGAAARLATLALPIGVGGQAAKAAVPVATRAGVARRAGQAILGGATGGATYGAIAGGLNADEDRLREAAKQGGIGALLGGAIGGATGLGTGLMEYFALNRLPKIKQTRLGRSEVTSRRAAAVANLFDETKVPTETARGALTPQQAFPKMGQAMDDLMRPDAASGMRMMDATDELQSLAKNAAQVDKKVSEPMLEAIAKDRIATQNADLASDVREALGAANVSGKKAQASVKARTKRLENTLYPRLFSAYPQPITSKEMQAAWQDAADELPKYIDNLRKNAKLSEQDILELTNAAGTAPTLQGAHRLKSAMSRSIRVLKNKEKANTLGADEAQALYALTNFNQRLTKAIHGAPGGKEYRQIQEIGRQGRAVRDALRQGETVMQADPYMIREMLQEAGQKPGGAQVQQALRQGAGSAVTRDLADRTAGSAEVLNEMANRAGTQERVARLATSPSAATRFASRMQDRKRMAETNRIQTGGATRHREILPGTRAFSMASDFGEAGAVGAAATLDAPRLLSSVQLWLGSMLAKGAQGLRRGSTEEAARELTQLILTRGVNDPAVPIALKDFLLEGMQQQQRRGMRAGGAGALLSDYLSRNWYSSTRTDR